MLGRPYVSGLITTEPSFTQRYGYFEMRAKLPAGRGLWPAFWLVSLTHTGHFEIDVFEMLGDEPRTIYQSTHHPGGGVHLRRDLGFDTSSDWHRYGLKWTREALVWYVDGKETARTDGAMFRDAAPMYMLANLAVGGDWPGPPDASTPFPVHLRIEDTAPIAIAAPSGERNADDGQRRVSFKGQKRRGRLPESGRACRRPGGRPLRLDQAAPQRHR